MTVRIVLVFMALAHPLASLTAPAAAVDGEILSASGRTIRLVGFDTPEGGKVAFPAGHLR